MPHLHVLCSQAEYRWFVPHDLPGLVGMFLSKEHYVKELDDFMNKTYCCPSTLLPNPYYWAGNEPDIREQYPHPSLYEISSVRANVFIFDLI